MVGLWCDINMGYDLPIEQNWQESPNSIDISAVIGKLLFFGFLIHLS